MELMLRCEQISYLLAEVSLIAGGVLIKEKNATHNQRHEVLKFYWNNDRDFIIILAIC